MENPTVKSLRLASVNSILSNLNRQCEAVLTLNNTSLPWKQPVKVKFKITPPNKKNGFSMTSTKNEKNKKEEEWKTKPDGSFDFRREK